jgi:hypothetical protein
MNFNDAMYEVVINKKIVRRKAFQFDQDNGDYDKPWSEWIRVRMDDDPVDFDALITFETRNHDDGTNPGWVPGHTWQEESLSKADVLATNWEISEEQE